MVKKESVEYQKEPMRKFLQSVGMTTWRLLRTEAQKRDISIQELLRSVIIPDWVKANHNENS